MTSLFVLVNTIFSFYCAQSSTTQSLFTTMYLPYSLPYASLIHYHIPPLFTTICLSYSLLYTSLIHYHMPPLFTAIYLPYSLSTVTSTTRTLITIDTESEALCWEKEVMYVHIHTHTCIVNAYVYMKLYIIIQ